MLTWMPSGPRGGFFFSFFLPFFFLFSSFSLFGVHTHTHTHTYSVANGRVYISTHTMFSAMKKKEKEGETPSAPSKGYF